MTEELEDRFKFMTEVIDGLSGWMWMKSDTECWNGLVDDWKAHHRHKWFKNVKNYDVVVQAGGHMGLYPSLLSKRFKKVYTFEAFPTNWFYLYANTTAPNIVVFPTCLTEQHGIMRMTDPPSQASFDIPAMIIDDLRLEQCDLIALDIEGHEVHALKGALQTINRCRPVIVCENGDKVKDLLQELKYEFAEVSALDTVFVPL